MKKCTVFFVVVAALLLTVSVSADFVFPNGLTSIESEAFMNDSSLNGLLTIPDQVEQIGDDAFSQTGLFAMEISSGTVHVGSQTLNCAAYVRLHGGNTALTGLHGIKYLIAPENSLARTYAENASILFISDEMLLEYDGFYYQQSDVGLTLLSAKDADQIHGTIVIPGKIGDKRVTGISSFAFYGCNGLERIHLPQILENHENLQDALHDCPAAEVIFDLDGPVVRSVTANMISGKIGETVTWTVEATSDVPIVSYLYTLEKDGQTIDTLQSNSSIYHTTIQSFGTYKLSVEVTDEKGQTAQGKSRKLYIAVEAMTMNVPETLLNGEDLEIQVNEVQDALSYSVYLTNETTGEYLGYRMLTEPGKAVFEGYLLNEGTWRITGYVYGNNFSYSIPTVRRVVISGTKPQGPEIPQYEPIIPWSELIVRLSESDPYAVKYQIVPNQGNGTGEIVRSFCSDNCYIYPGDAYGDWLNGGRILVSGAVKQDGVWTGWGPVTEVTVLPAPKLNTPELTAPAQSQAGKDLTISFTSVEHANCYNLYLFEGYDPEKTTWKDERENAIIFEQYSHGDSVVIPGYYLSSGVYTLSMYVWSDDAYYESDWVSQKLEISGEQPEAPLLNADKTEQNVQGDTLTLSIHAEGAEGAYVFCDIFRNGRKDEKLEPWSISLDENGNGIYQRSWDFSDESGYVGLTFRYRATAIVNGIWSKISEPVDVLMTEGNPLSAPVVQAVETIQAGEDFAFRISPVEDAVSYIAILQRAYGDEMIYSWFGNECVPNQDLIAPGCLMQSGTYRLIVKAYSQERGESKTEILFSVNGSKPEVTVVSGYPEKVHINENISFAIDTTDATDMYVRWRHIPPDGSDYGWETERLDVSSESTDWSYWVDEYCKDFILSFQFSVRRNGIWTAWQTVEMIVLDLPPLQPVTIHAQETYEAGEDISFTYEPVEHAESYRIYLLRDDHTVKSYSDTVPRMHSICGYDIEPGIYRIRIVASSDSYISSNSESVITVSGEKAAAPDVEVDKTEVTASESYSFTIDTENVEELVYRSSESVDHWWDVYSINVLEDITRWSTTNGNSDGETRYYSFATRRNGLWTAWSDPIAVTTLKEDTSAVISMSLPSTVTVGQDLNVHIEPIENAGELFINLYNSHGAEVTSISVQGAEGANGTISGYLLSQGVYRVEAVSVDNRTIGSSEATVNVIAGERPEVPIVTADCEFGRVNVQYGFTIETADADKVAVRYYRDGYPNDVNYRSFSTSGESTRWQDSHSTSGDIWKYAFAIRKNGIWSPWSSIAIVEITDRDMLEKPVLHVPESIEAGSDLYLSFSGVEHADSYTMRLADPNGNQQSWTVYPDTQRRVMGYDLVPGTYTVSVTASGAEYDSSVAVQSLTVTGTRTEAPIVTADPVEVFTNETYTFFIETADSQEVAYRYTYGTSGSSSGTLNVLSDHTIWETSAYNSGTRSYSFCVLRGNRWSAWSQPIDIVVNTRPQLPLPEVAAPESILMGRNLTVTVSPVEGATNYGVVLYNNRDQQITEIWRSTPGEFLFQGYRLQAGSIRINVTVYGQNGSSRTVTKNLTVTMAQQPESPTVTAPEQTTVSPQTNYYFDIQTEGAELGAVRYYRIGNPNELSMQNFSVSTTESTTTWRGYQYSGGNTYAYSFAVLKDGVWSEWSSFIEITVQ